MITESSLPAEYQRLSRVTFCSSILEDGQIPIVIGSMVPLLIGKGSQPMIWLEAPLDVAASKSISLLRGSVPQHSLITINSSSAGAKVFLANREILTIEDFDGSSAEVSQIDLRPLGVNLFGDQDGITAMTNRIVRMRMKGGSALIHIATSDSNSVGS